ncbi:MAG: tRNA pseudouridine(55) synthase TruB [Rubripirellula sp.]
MSSPPPFGFLCCNKPTGMTSRDVVNVVQRRLPRKTKVGHAGTLDPLAEGVLVIGIGPAVRLVPYVQQQPKHYVATFRLGQSSVSGDLEGEITHHDNLPEPTREQLDDAALTLVGQVEQTPPAHSAIWVDGRRAYQRIRAGEEFEMPKRIVQVDRFTITRYAYPEVDLDIVCGSGTYIRTLGIDLAIAAGSTSVMSFLSRVGVGSFRLEDSVSIETLRDGDFLSSLLPASRAVEHLSHASVCDEESARLGNGLCIDLSEDRYEDRGQAGVVVARLADAEPQETTQEQVPEIAAMDREGRLRAILRRKRGQWCPYRVFATED